MRELDERTALYRIRGEADLLLYIGISWSPALRWNQHQVTQPWWDELRSLTVEWYDSRPEAEAAEEAAVVAELPKYNKTYLVTARTGRKQPKPPKVYPIRRGAVELEPWPDDEDLMSLREVAKFTQLTTGEVRGALIQTGGPYGLDLGDLTLFRRGDIRQWIADLTVETKQTAYGRGVA
jgi:hypothetical protein